MNTKKQTNPNSLANLKPIPKGTVLNPNGARGAKKRLESIFKSCVTDDEYKSIIRKAVDDAIQGDNKSREFIFSYSFGKPNVMIDLLDSKGQTFIQNNFNVEVKGKGEEELTNLLIELSNDDVTEEENEENLE